MSLPNIIILLVNMLQILMKRRLQAIGKKKKRITVSQMLQNTQAHTAVLQLRKFFYTSSLEAHITYLFLNMYWGENVHLVRYILCKNITQDFLVNSLNCGNHYHHQTLGYAHYAKSFLMLFGVCHLLSVSIFFSFSLHFK